MKNNTASLRAGAHIDVAIPCGCAPAAKSFHNDIDLHHMRCLIPAAHTFLLVQPLVAKFSSPVGGHSGREMISLAQQNKEGTL